MGLWVVQRHLDHLRNLLVRLCGQKTVQNPFIFTFCHHRLPYKINRTQIHCDTNKHSEVLVTSRRRPTAWHGGRTSWLVSAALSMHLLNDCFLCVSQWAGAAFLHLLHYWVRRSLKTWLSSSMTSLDFQRLVCGVKQTANNITTAVKLQKKKTKSTIKFHNIQLVHCVSGFLKPYDSFVWETNLKLKFFVTCSIFMNHFDPKTYF